MLIKKNPNSYDNILPSYGEYKLLIDSVDLSDIIEFIKNLNHEDWVPNCYWKNKGKDIFDKFYFGSLYWAIYSYLIDKKLLVIEDRYYGYRTEKYKNRSSYFNTLEKDLYQPIVDRLVDNGCLILDEFNFYSLSKCYIREDKLNKLFI